MDQQSLEPVCGIPLEEGDHGKKATSSILVDIRRGDAVTIHQPFTLPASAGNGTEQPSKPPYTCTVTFTLHSALP